MGWSPQKGSHNRHPDRNPKQCLTIGMATGTNHGHPQVPTIGTSNGHPIGTDCDVPPHTWYMTCRQELHMCAVDATCLLSLKCRTDNCVSQSSGDGIYNHAVIHINSCYNITRNTPYILLSVLFFVFELWPNLKIGTICGNPLISHMIRKCVKPLTLDIN